MSPSCPACGQPITGPARCSCPPQDPFPLEDFAPELQPPASPPAPPDAGDPPAARPVLEIVRPRAAQPTGSNAPAGPTELALAEAAADAARAGRQRTRGRLPAGIRLVIGRRRKTPPRPESRPAPTPPPALTAPQPPPARSAPEAPQAPPEAPTPAPSRPALGRSSHPELERQARLFDAPSRESARPDQAPDEAPAPPPAAPAREPAPPRTDPATAAQAMGGLLGAFGQAPTARATPPPPSSPPAAPASPAAAPGSAALAPSRGAGPPARVDRVLRAERVRLREEDDGRPRSPRPPPRQPRRSPGRAVADLLGGVVATLSGAVASIASLVAGPAGAALVGLAAMGAAAVFAPAAMAPMLGVAAIAACALDARAARPVSPASLRLTGAALAAGTLTTIIALAVRAGMDLPPIIGWIARPHALGAALGVTALGLAAWAATALARRFRAPALASTALPMTALAAAATIAPGPPGLAVASAALAACALASARGDRTDGLRLPTRAWAVVAAALALAVLALAPALGAPGAGGWLALAILSPVAGVAALRLSCSYVPETRGMARPLAMAMAVAATVMLLLVGRAAGLPLATVAAALPLAALGHPVLSRWRQARHHSSQQAAWLATDARALVLLYSVVTISLVIAAGGAGGALAAAVLATTLAAFTLVDPAIAARPAGRLGAIVLSWTALVAAASALGMSRAWLPALAASVLALAILACGLAARRGARRLADLPWTWPALGGAAAALGGALAACVEGAWLAGGLGVVTAALAPLALRALPRPLGDRDGGAVASPHATGVQLALAAVVPAAPLAALGHAAWIAPLLAAEGIALWALSRRRLEALGPLAGLLVATVAALPLLATRAGWIPGLLALAAWSVTGALEAWEAGRRPARGTRRAAAVVAVGAVVVLAAWVSSAFQATAMTLVVLALVLQALDRACDDAVLADVLRGGAAMAWTCGAGVAALTVATDALTSAILLAGAALVGLLIAALRRHEASTFRAGLAAAGALAAACLHVGISPASHPAVFVAPAASFLVAWSVWQAWTGRAFRLLMSCGLGLLAGAVLLEAHLPAAPPLLRIVAGALAATMIAGGVLSTHRIPVIAGAAALLAEGLWLLGEGVLLAWQAPAMGLAVLGSVLVVIAGTLVHLGWRAGGRASLTLAWASDLARLREAWGRWH